MVILLPIERKKTYRSAMLKQFCKLIIKGLERRGKIRGRQNNRDGLYREIKKYIR